MSQPTSSCFSLYGIQYAVDLEACRMRMLERVAELGAGRRRGGMQLVAHAAGVDRATLRRFFQGERVSVESFVSIVTRGLLLDVPKVAQASRAA